MFPEHPEIANALSTGHPHPYKSVFCINCGKELGDKVYISYGDVHCEDCTRDMILASYNTGELAEALGIQCTTVGEYLNSQEEL